MRRNEAVSRGGRVRTLGIGVALGLAALALLRAAGLMQESWRSETPAEFRMDVSGWIAWLVVYGVAGFLATLAFRVPTRLRYRPVRALLGALVPVVLLAQMLMFFAGWTLPLAIRGPVTWVSSETLAVLVGVALACGFDVDGSRDVARADREPSRRPEAARLGEPVTRSGRP